jgi:hypothetical protein
MKYFQRIIKKKTEETNELAHYLRKVKSKKVIFHKILRDATEN